MNEEITKINNNDKTSNDNKNTLYDNNDISYKNILDIKNNISKNNESIDIDNKNIVDKNDTIDIIDTTDIIDNVIGGKNNIEKDFKLKHIPKINRTTRTYKYKLGINREKRKAGVLIKNRDTQKRIKNEIGLLKKKSIQEIKNYLREKNLIKVGSNAPPDILRKIYEDSILSGDIKNNNSSNLIHNFLNN